MTTTWQTESDASSRDEASDSDAVPREPRVVLRHPAFRQFIDPVFRISETERKPVLVIQMDGNDASLSLTGLMHEFRISPTDADGIMLRLVARALEFVTSLRIGDPLPPEVLSGRASWAADQVSFDRAIVRLNMQLLFWMYGRTDAATRAQLSNANGSILNGETLAFGMRRLAAQIGTITPGDVLARIQRTANELAHIEALRDRLLRGAERLSAELGRFAREFSGDQTHKELLSQVRRLAATGVADLKARFDAADLAVTDIARVVGHTDETIAEIRRHRDDLYVRCRVWEPVTTEWSTIEAGQIARTWQLVHETYRFLAPRFISTVEWVGSPDQVVAARQPRPGMVW